MNKCHSLRLPLKSIHLHNHMEATDKKEKKERILIHLSHCCIEYKRRWERVEHHSIMIIVLFNTSSSGQSQYQQFLFFLWPWTCEAVFSRGAISSFVKREKAENTSLSTQIYSIVHSLIHSFILQILMSKALFQVPEIFPCTRQTHFVP